MAWCTNIYCNTFVTEYLTDYPAKVAGMGRNARALAKRSFARGKLADEFVDCVEKVDPQITQIDADWKR